MNEELKKALALLAAAKDNTEVAAAVGEVFKQADFSVEDFKKFAETADGRKFIDSIADARATKGLETFKTGTMKELLKTETEKAIEEFKKSSGITLSDDQKQINELRKQQAALQAELASSKLATSRESLLSRSKVPAEFRNFITGSDEDSIAKSIESFSSAYDARVAADVKAAVDKEVAKFKMQPGGSDNPPANVTEQMLNDAFKKAQSSGTEDDHIAYVNLKDQMYLQNNK